MEKPKPRVKIVQVCKVAPPPETTLDLDSATSKSLPLTFFDMIWLRLRPPQILYLYEISNPSAEFFHSHILPRLKKSLSLALQHFLPIAGNLTWPESSHVPVIKYAQGDAVLLTVAESDDDFYRLSRTEEYFEATAYHPLVANLANSRDRAAALALQITLFPHSGFSIGITLHHGVLDGRSLQMFVKSWAHMCRLIGEQIDDHHESLSLPPELKPFYDRAAIKNPANLNEETVDLDRSLVFSGGDKDVLTDSIRRTFQLTRENIEQLRQIVNKQHACRHQVLRASTFSLTYAYILCCLVKAEGISEHDKVVAIFAVDCRSRLEPPLPSTYFGNCVVAGIIETKGLLGREGGLSVAVKEIIEAIKSLEMSEVLINEAEKRGSQIMSSIRSANRVYSISGSPRFEVYSTDFGWGRPKKRDIVSIDRTGAISLSDSRNGDGVEISLVLKKHQMEAFASLFAQGLDSS